MVQLLLNDINLVDLNDGLCFIQTYYLNISNSNFSEFYKLFNN